MNDAELDSLIETSWRRDLSPAELRELQQLLEKNSAARARWESEAALNSLLSMLPAGPVPSNFTSRVMQDISGLETARHSQPSVWRIVLPRRFAWAWRVGFAVLVLGGGIFGYGQVQAARQRALVRSLVTVSQVSPVPSPEILQDFDAIRMLDQNPSADEELLNLMR